jgi:hypothetical protein
MRRWALAIGGLLALAGQVAAEGPMRTFYVGEWRAGAYTNDRSGQFSHCAAWAPYRSGISFFVSVDRDFNWRLAFSHPRWQFRQGQTIPFSLLFDGAGPVRVEARATSRDLVMINMPVNSALIRAFREARLMEAYAMGERFAFKLDGTSRLMPALVDCVRNSVSPPAVARPVEPRSPSGDPDLDKRRDRLLTQAASEHAACLKKNMRDIVPYSSERAEVLAQVVLTKCAPEEERFVSVGVALLNVPRAQVEREVRQALARQKEAIVAEIVTFRAELAKSLLNKDAPSEAAPAPLPKREGPVKETPI